MKSLLRASVCKMLTRWRVAHIIWCLCMNLTCVIMLGLVENTWQNVYVVSQPQVSCQYLSEQVSQTLIAPPLSLHITPSTSCSVIHSNLSGSLQEFPFIWCLSVLSVSCSFPPFSSYIFSFLKLSACLLLPTYHLWGEEGRSCRQLTQSCGSPCFVLDFVWTETLEKVKC